MITLHHLNESRSRRIVWLLEEIGAPYELVHHQRDPRTRLAPDSLKAVHPLAKAPVIVDGDVTICESGAVVEYILDKHGEGRLRPAKDAPNYYAYLEWLHFAEGSLALPLITGMIMGREERAGDKPLDFYIGKETALDLAHIEATLAERVYFAGVEFTAADVMMVFLLDGADRRGLLDDRPNTRAYLEKIRTRPAYQKALEMG